MLGEVDMGQSLARLLDNPSGRAGGLYGSVKMERKRDVDRTKGLIIEAMTEVMDEIRLLKESIGQYRECEVVAHCIKQRSNSSSSTDRFGRTNESIVYTHP